MSDARTYQIIVTNQHGDELPRQSFELLDRTADHIAG